MRIGILTLHYSNNYGAVLQAWALRKVLSAFDGCQADIVNYIPAFFNFKLSEVTDDELLLFKKKRQLFELFLIEECDIKHQRLDTIPDNEYDYLIVGSDQVWNFNLPHTANGAYLLNDIRYSKKISYAASVGMDYSLAEKYADRFMNALPSFKKVSVRESIHQRFLRDICNVESSCVVDPTWLLEPSDYEVLLDDIHTNKDYILFFWLDKTTMLWGKDFANILSVKYGLEIKHTLINENEYDFVNSGGSIANCSIGAFLSYIKNARFVITDSYHVTLFAVQYEVPMYIFASRGMRSRFEELAQNYFLGDRIVDKFISPSKLTKDIDFEKIKNRISERRTASIKFLMDAVYVS